MYLKLANPTSSQHFEDSNHQFRPYESQIMKKAPIPACVGDLLYDGHVYHI
ncbi:predicted protein [Uncinocarpus reesii 1704]|uniref:Uncharacterized protein n=1 Tax=Uncinocarpus reesii (strain UAMH 1704) TaxID=336963 RepID=C4JL35_UNCRE|nr:uncharacterized protein UREG_00250 [Uncinocarpus reesii 1704]EEP75404.1 predicted protein [Uncinocarpus reesii 1704]